MNGPDYEIDFYIEQNKFMLARYEAIFKSYRLPWKTYISKVNFKLRNNQYFLWIFLCGLEPLLREIAEARKCYKNLKLFQDYVKPKLAKDRNIRCYNIYQPFVKEQQYVQDLSRNQDDFLFLD